MTFSRLEAGYSGDWHPAPRRQFDFILSGRIELTASDGEVRSFVDLRAGPVLQGSHS